MDLSERFWSKINILGKDDCWNWTASTFNVGYGSFKYNGKVVGSNRMTWFLTYGEFPKLCVLHTCDNRLCCNPNHLFLGTNQDNSDDKVSKGRQAKGSNNGRSLLTEDEVLKIKNILSNGDMVQSEIAKKFGVVPQTISDIKNRKSWFWL